MFNELFNAYSSFKDTTDTNTVLESEKKPFLKTCWGYANLDVRRGPSAKHRQITSFPPQSKRKSSSILCSRRSPAAMLSWKASFSFNSCCTDSQANVQRQDGRWCWLKRMEEGHCRGWKQQYWTIMTYRNHDTIRTTTVGMYVWTILWGRYLWCIDADRSEKR